MIRYPAYPDCSNSCVYQRIRKAELTSEFLNVPKQGKMKQLLVGSLQFKLFIISHPSLNSKGLFVDKKTSCITYDGSIVEIESAMCFVEANFFAQSAIFNQAWLLPSCYIFLIFLPFIFIFPFKSLTPLRIQYYDPQGQEVSGVPFANSAVAPERHGCPAAPSGPTVCPAGGCPGPFSMRGLNSHFQPYIFLWFSPIPNLILFMIHHSVLVSSCRTDPSPQPTVHRTNLNFSPVTNTGKSLLS